GADGRRRDPDGSGPEYPVAEPDRPGLGDTQCGLPALHGGGVGTGEVPISHEIRAAGEAQRDKVLLELLHVGAADSDGHDTIGSLAAVEQRNRAPVNRVERLALADDGTDRRQTGVARATRAGSG